MTEMIDELTEMVTPVLDEELVALQWFYPQGRWKTSGMSWTRLARGVFGKSRLDERLPLQSVLVLTPTRVLVFGTSTSSGHFAVTDQLGEWPRAAVTAAKESIELSTGGYSGSAGYEHRGRAKKFSRLSLHTPDGELGADLPAGERASQQVAKLLVH